MGPSKRRPYQRNEHERAQGIRQLRRTALREVRLGQHRGSIILLISSGRGKMTSARSSALTYILEVSFSVGPGEAERAIKRGERGIRLSPFDPWAFHALTLGHFHCDRHAEAANAAYKAIQSNPAHSISYMLLAAPREFGRLEEPRVAAARVLELRRRSPRRWARRYAIRRCRLDLTWRATMQ